TSRTPIRPPPTTPPPLHTPPPTPQTSTLSLHDALPIYTLARPSSSDLLHALKLTNPRAVTEPNAHLDRDIPRRAVYARLWEEVKDRKSTRLNSSHDQISYAVFCLKKKKEKQDGCMYLQW